MSIIRGRCLPFSYIISLFRLYGRTTSYCLWMLFIVQTSCHMQPSRLLHLWLLHRIHYIIPEATASSDGDWLEDSMRMSTHHAILGHVFAGGTSTSPFRWFHFFKTPGLAMIDFARRWGDLRRAARKQAEKSKEGQGTTSPDMADPPTAGQAKSHVRSPLRTLQSYLRCRSFLACYA